MNAGDELKISFNTHHNGSNYFGETSVSNIQPACSAQGKVLDSSLNFDQPPVRANMVFPHKTTSKYINVHLILFGTNRTPI